MKRFIFYSSVLTIICLLALSSKLRIVTHPLFLKIRGKYTIEERLQDYGASSRERWHTFFQKNKISYPPPKVIFVGIKAERILQVYAQSRNDSFEFLRSFPICAASGKPGPKILEGDRQVPEGIYRISFLNPNSLYHLSLRLNYPNTFDREKGTLDGRKNLGGDIMIHGDCISIGCLAMGDRAAEDLFVLAADVGIENTEVIMAPFDFRSRAFTEKDLSGLPEWTRTLYVTIEERLKQLPLS